MGCLRAIVRGKVLSLDKWQSLTAGGLARLQYHRRQRRLREMTRHVRRKTEVVGLTNEQHFPHLVELAVPPEGLRHALLEFDAFHRERRIPVYRGRSRQVAERFHIRFCFPDADLADAFPDRFGA